MRLRAFLLVSLFALMLAACSTAGSDGSRASAAGRPECQDPDWFGITACSCGRCDY
jgi:hypothetical protein